MFLFCFVFLLCLVFHAVAMAASMTAMAAS